MVSFKHSSSNKVWEVKRQVTSIESCGHSASLAISSRRSFSIFQWGSFRNLCSKADRLDFKVANRISCFVICSEFEPDPSEEKSIKLHTWKTNCASLHEECLAHSSSSSEAWLQMSLLLERGPPTMPPQARQNSRPHFLPYHSTFHVVRIMYRTHNIGLAKKFIWVFESILWKDLSELFGRPNTSWFVSIPHTFWGDRVLVAPEPRGQILINLLGWNYIEKRNLKR